MLSVCAVIISYNPDSRIINNVNALLEQVDKIIIVDNNSTTGLDFIHQFNKNKKIILHFNPENFGIAKALNIGIDYALAENYKWLLTLDQDSIARPDMISTMLSLPVAESPDTAVISPSIFDSNLNKFTYTISSEFESVKHSIQSGCLFKLNAVIKTGYFNEKLFIYYVDDEYCYRLLKNKFKIYRSKNAVLEHEEGEKTNIKFFGINFIYTNYSQNAIYYIERNTLYMSIKYNPLIAKRLLNDFIKILLFEKKIKRKKISYFFKGIWDALMNNYGKMK